ncbi:MAG: acyl-CoA dehydrogenase [Xanthomonadales bacterium]|nr:acyl-CoA dehydrogenase [Xanthomonadales bacterium]NIX12172.1 acyl-CoA dehydrogenase [Xanthomonadales bacterium]
MTWLLLIVLLGVSLVCAFQGTRLVTWTAALAGAFLLFALGGLAPVVTLVIVGILLAAVLVPLNIARIRQQLVSEPFLKQYRKMLPTLSDTEKAAMEAGTVGWEGELFSGKPDWKALLKRPYLTLTDEEQAFVDGPTEELCGMLRQWEISHELADMPPEVWEFCKKNKFFGMIIPKEYGGLGFSALGHRAVLQKISSISAVAGSNVAVPNSLGPAELLLHYGTEEQKNHYLPRLAVGEEIPCFALTGPTAGSDATSIPDHGVICKGQYRGEEVLGMRLNFDKRYITLAPVATVIGLAVKLYDPDGLLGGERELGISLALVPRDTEGVEVGTRHLPLNVPFQNGPVRGKDVFLPLDALIGGADMIGKGWRMLVECLSVGRAITLPSSSTGGAKMGSLATGAYARIRKQFNLPIGRFEGVEEALSRIAGKTYQISALSRMTATAVDLGEKPAVPSAIAKYHATEMAREIITDVMDIHGGKGIILGPRNYLGRAWQGAPIWITVEGANILTRSLMIFGQGAIRCHPFVLKEIAASRIEDPKTSLREFDKLLFGHIGYSIRNAVRSLVLGFSRGRLTRVPVPHDRRLSGFYRKLTRYSAALAFASDVAMLTLGGKLKHKERISARLGDALSQLYICSAMLARYEAQDRPSKDQPILAWAFHDAIFKIQTALAGVADNFPNRLMRVLLHLVVFPLGRRERQPGDRLSHKVAQLMLSPSTTRDRLTDGIYVSPEHPVGFMEAALPEVIAAEPLERRMLKAQQSGTLDALTWEEQLAQAVERSVISETEAETLKQVRAKVLEIIAVDEFESEALRLGAPGSTEVQTSEAA